MANLNKNDRRPGDPILDPKSMTEQEHKDSCDINKMIGDLALGKPVRSSDKVLYGHDDLTISSTEFHIQKKAIENELVDIAENHEFTEEELKHIPPQVQKRFKLKTKPKTNDDKTQNNDDKTQTTTTPPQPPSTKS